MQKNRSKIFVASIFVLTIIVSAVTGFIGGYAEREVFNALSSGIPESSNSPVAATVDSNTTRLEALVKQINPSVVNISVATQSFGRFGQSQDAQAEGTGMILTRDGYILTNRHVISGSPSSISVKLSDGTQYSADVVALSPDNDIGIIKIDATDLTPVRLGNSDLAVLGQSVIAIGNTLGEFQNTVTQGIISGLDRSILAGESIYDVESLSGLLQTDAAINPGNSGGPLVDERTGTVIGINTATSTNAQSIGFVIPINQAKDFIREQVPTALQ